MTESEAKAYLHVRGVIIEAMAEHQSLSCCWHALAAILNKLGHETMRAGGVIYGQGDWDCPEEQPYFTAEDH